MKETEAKNKPLDEQAKAGIAQIQAELAAEGRLGSSLEWTEGQSK